MSQKFCREKLCDIEPVSKNFFLTIYFHGKVKQGGKVFNSQLKTCFIDHQVRRAAQKTFLVVLTDFMSILVIEIKESDKYSPAGLNFALWD